MKIEKHLALYQEPLIKVVSFTIEGGFANSLTGGSEAGEDGPGIPIDDNGGGMGDGEEIPLFGRRSNGVDAAATSHFGGF